MHRGGKGKSLSNEPANCKHSITIILLKLAFNLRAFPLFRKFSFFCCCPVEIGSERLKKKSLHYCCNNPMGGKGF